MARLRLIVPEHLQEPVRGYVEDGWPPGGFLSAVIDNNLFESFACADEASAAGMRGLVTWFESYAPRGCFGSREARHEWLLCFAGEAEVAE